MDFSKTYKTDSSDEGLKIQEERKKNENTQFREKISSYKPQETRKTSSSMHQRTLHHHNHAISALVNRSSS
jgi:hypothetical protein